MNISKQANYFEIKFERKIDYKLYEQFGKIEVIDFTYIQIVYLDFSLTNYISLPGAVYIVYFLNHFKSLNNSFETRIKSINENVAISLAKFGFFKCSKFYCNLKLDNTLEKLNNKYLKKYNLNNIQDQTSIYWPIRTIPMKSGKSFESDDSGFTNSFVDYFNLIVTQKILPLYEISREDVKKGFVKAAYELGLNIWEHSESWGLCAIQSTEKTKTTLVICDYGVGFIGSYIKNNPNYISNLGNDKKIIESLLKDGGTSKLEMKNGHGLTRVMKFTQQVNGTLLIRTDKFEITLRGKQEKPELKNKKYFKGTQVFINF